MKMHSTHLFLHIHYRGVNFFELGNARDPPYSHFLFHVGLLLATTPMV